MGGAGPDAIPPRAQLAQGTAPKLPTTGKPLAGKTIEVLSAPPVIPWGTLVNPGITKDFERLGAKVKLQTYSTQANPTQQAQQLQAALTQHPDAIVMDALDQKGLVPQLLRAKAQKIPVVFLGPPVDTSLYTQHLVATAVTSPSYAEGVWAAKMLVKGLRTERRTSGNVLLLSGSTADATSLDYNAGFKQQLAKTPQYKLAGIAYTNYDATTAAQVTGPWLAKYTNKGGIAGIYAVAGDLALGAVQAAKQAGVKVGVANKGMVLVTSSCMAPDWKATLNGTIYANGVHWPPYDADGGAAAAVAAIQGKSLPMDSTTPTWFFTRKNAKKYKAVCNYA